MILEEVDYANKKLDLLQKDFKDIPVTYLEGNHEYRVFRYIRDIAPQLWGLTDCPKLFNFETRPLWKFITYGPSQLVKVGKCNDLYCRHEPLGGGQFHAKQTAEKALCSIIYGHTHTYQQYMHKKFGPTPKYIRAISNGWLGDITKGCFDYRGPKDNWQNGFMRVDCDEESGEFELRFQFL